PPRDRSGASAARKPLACDKRPPRAACRVLLRTGWKSQQTEELKPTGWPDNLFEPLPGDPGAHGRFDDRARATTAWTWLRLHRAVIGAGLGLGTIGLLAGLRGRFPPSRGMSQSWRVWS